MPFLVSQAILSLFLVPICRDWRMLNALTENAGRIPGFSITVSQSVASCVSVCQGSWEAVCWTEGQWRSAWQHRCQGGCHSCSSQLRPPSVWLDTHTHTHAHLTAVCPGLRTWAGTRKVKPMQVCTSLQTDNHTSTPQLSFLQARYPSCHLTNSIKALKAQYDIMACSDTVWYCILLWKSDRDPGLSTATRLYILITVMQFLSRAV